MDKKNTSGSHEYPLEQRQAHSYLEPLYSITITNSQTETVQTLRDNTYVDNLMKTGQGLEDMERFKSEATQILEAARFPVHKCESNYSRT